MNTLQSIYLMAHWHYNSVTSHVTKKLWQQQSYLQF